jgi:hypothetical protein
VWHNPKNKFNHLLSKTKIYVEMTQGRMNTNFPRENLCSLPCGGPGGGPCLKKHVARKKKKTMPLKENLWPIIIIIIIIII